MALKNTPVESNKSTNPFTSFHHEMNDFFDRFVKELFPEKNQGQFMPRIELKDAGTRFQICAELPGMKESDIDISLKDRTLIIQGEKKNEQKQEGKGYFRSEISYGSFYRAIPLPGDIDQDKVHATYQDGILRIDIEKQTDAEGNVKKISIGTKH